MDADILIKGGRIIDSAKRIDGIGDVAVKGDRILSVGESLAIKANIVVDARDCIVSPGLIDNHLHMFADGTDAGVDPNIALLPNGVTTAVEGGSPGASNYELYRKVIMNGCRARIKCYINVSPTGMSTRRHPENVNPDFYDSEKLRTLFDKYPDELLGLKLRLSKEIAGDMNAKPLEETIKLAEEIGCRIVVHTTNPSIDTERIASMLRPGDIFCHVFQRKGDTIIGLDGRVKPGIKAAKDRGVIFDACNGSYNFAFRVAKAALDDNFYPDIISTDLNTLNLYKHPVISLPYVMSKYINMGMAIEKIFRSCTRTPALLMGMDGRIGTIAPGAFADVAIFKLINHDTIFYDYLNDHVSGGKLLVPQMTIKDGIIMFRQVSFNSEMR
jgi:dihydroorotase